MNESVDLWRLYTSPRFRALAERIGPVTAETFNEVAVFDLLLTLTQYQEHDAIALAGILGGEEEIRGADTVWNLVREWHRPDVREAVQRMLLERTGAAVEMVQRAQGLEDLASLEPARTCVVLYWLLRKLGRHELAGELELRFRTELASLGPLLWVCRLLLKASRDAPEMLDELRGATLWTRPDHRGTVH